MAQGDVTVFEEAKEWLCDGTFDLDGDSFKLFIIDNTAAPTAADATPAYADYSANEMDAVGDYTAGGTALTVTWSEAAGTATFATSTTVTVTANGSHTKDAYWGIVYADNVTTPVADTAVCYIQLSTGTGVDIATTDLTINSGTIFTLA